LCGVRGAWLWSSESTRFFRPTSTCTGSRRGSIHPGGAFLQEGERLGMCHNPGFSHNKTQASSPGAPYLETHVSTARTGHSCARPPNKRPATSLFFFVLFLFFFLFVPLGCGTNPWAGARPAHFVPGLRAVFLRARSGPSRRGARLPGKGERNALHHDRGSSRGRLSTERHRGRRWGQRGGGNGKHPRGCSPGERHTAGQKFRQPGGDDSGRCFRKRRLCRRGAARAAQFSTVDVRDAGEESKELEGPVRGIFFIRRQ